MKTMLTLIALHLAIFQAIQTDLSDIMIEYVGKDLMRLVKDIKDYMEGKAISVNMLEQLIKAALKMFVLAEDARSFEISWSEIAIAAK